MSGIEYITGEALEHALRGVGLAVREAIEPLQERIAALEQAAAAPESVDELVTTLLVHEGRLAKLEDEKPLLRFRGRWQIEDAGTYAKGDVASHRRCLYVCVRPTDAVPGSNTGWALMVRGVDAPPPRNRPDGGWQS